MVVLSMIVSGLAGCDILTSPETRIERATAMIENGAYRKAVFELRQVLDDEPGHARARLLLAQAEFGSGEVTAAEADLNRALEAGLAASDAALLKARIQLVLGRPQVLLTQLDAGELVLPEPQLSLFRARALMAMRQPAEAMSAFESASRHSPDSIETRLGIAEGKAANGDVSGALAILPRWSGWQPRQAWLDGVVAHRGDSRTANPRWARRCSTPRGS
jgi:thioredoxin-like negative regulator of GroEL